MSHMHTHRNKALSYSIDLIDMTLIWRQETYLCNMCTIDFTELYNSLIWKILASSDCSVCLKWDQSTFQTCQP
jgi:hypothetical protein